MKPPEKIYLQVDEDEGYNPDHEIIWCVDRIDKTDLEYALVPPWTSELPTEDGWYWTKNRYEIVSIRQLTITKNGVWLNKRHDISSWNWQFSGPIPMPEEK